MIERSFDKDLLWEATEELRYMLPKEKLDDFWSRPHNLMFVEDGNVGLATLEYPGVYSVHWYFKVRGRDAINLGKRMVANLFENYGAETVRGVISKHLKASRWACRQLGFKSYGFVTYADGEENELFCATKKEFLEGLKLTNG